jgi:SET domain-containing protein
MGAFAEKLITRGTQIVEYCGERISKAECHRRCAANNRFIFAVDEEWYVDGDVKWNPARFLNHSCAPNCEAVLAMGQIWIMALRDIAAGEELTFNYGFDLEDYREHVCRCGSPGCVGYIVGEQFFDHVRRQTLA